jgi:hypothetical protein
MIIAVFDMNAPDTLQSIRSHWMPEIYHNDSENTQIKIIRNKSDLECQMYKNSSVY